MFEEFVDGVERIRARSFVFKIAVSHQTLRRADAEIAKNFVDKSASGAVVRLPPSLVWFRPIFPDQ